MIMFKRINVNQYISKRFLKIGNPFALIKGRERWRRSGRGLGKGRTFSYLPLHYNQNYVVRKPKDQIRGVCECQDVDTAPLNSLIIQYKL